MNMAMRLAASVTGCMLLAGAGAARGQTLTTSAPAAVVTYPEIASGDPETPAIHGPRVVGTTPGRPFLFLVPVTGKGKVTVSAEGLPAGLTLDTSTGIITGSVAAPGEWTVRLGVRNELGAAARKLRIVAGTHKLALTPPMGWNSWNAWARAVTQENVKAAADAMVASGLAAKGYAYVNIDDCWEGKERDKVTGEITTNEKFPDMKGLADHVHSRGLKIGIYSSPGPQTCAGFLGSHEHEDLDAKVWARWGMDFVKHDWCSYDSVYSTRIVASYVAALGGEDGKKYAAARAEFEPLRRKSRRTPEEETRFVAARETIDALLATLGEKRRDLELAERQRPYRLMRAALDKTDRDIVYSLCQYGTANVSEWGGSAGIHGNLWRTTGDITDTWKSMTGIWDRQADLARYARPGQWNDPDMLIVGKVGWGPSLRPTNLTPDEQLTHITLWSMLAAPLLIGCDMTDMDKFTTDLLTNTEVIDIDQDPLGKQATRVMQQFLDKGAAATSRPALTTRRSPGATVATEAWARPLFDSTVAVALFNRSDTVQDPFVRWDMIGVTGKQTVRDLWRRKDLGVFENAFRAKVPPHGCILIKIGTPREE